MADCLKIHRMNEESVGPGWARPESPAKLSAELDASKSGKKRSYSRSDGEITASSDSISSNGPLLLHTVAQDDISPVDFAINIFRRHHGEEPKIRPSVLCRRFQAPTEAQIALYDQDILQIVRDQDIAKLREVYVSGRSIQCCNRFGESLLHMACRRGFADIARFMVQEAKVSVYVRDDYGRTPMHDACWCTEPNFEIVEMLLQEAPEQIFLSDVRGHTPFSYTRRNHWSDWNKFLQKHESSLLRIAVGDEDFGE